ncbi:MAG TPA: DmsE family decaheme c-type cytochrome [Thermoanaerobaculia bacterium]
MRLPYLLVPVAAVALLAAASGSGATPRQQEPAEPQPAPAHATAPAYVGTETCVACHDTVATHLGGTPHGKAAFARLSAQGCETCHGPGGAHAENPDDPALHPRIDRLSVAAQVAICRTCHDGGEQMFWQGSRHHARGLSCISCHSVHTPKSEPQLKTATVAEQCFACHKDVRAETWKNSHHPIREGKISCVDCHNPHGSPTPKLIRAASVNDQCYSCHTEKRGPFLWDHPPVRESCLNCHTPHGSNHLKLQKTSVPYLCQQCHANTRHPGTLYDGLRVPTLEDPARGSNRVFNRACLDCHAAIHGSNHPSAPYLAH